MHPTKTIRGDSAIMIINNIKHFEGEKYEIRDNQVTNVSIETS
jgi:hypothetical protein